MKKGLFSQTVKVRGQGVRKPALQARSNVCEQRSSAEILVLGRQRTQRNTGSAFQIDWQQDNGFF